MKTHTRPAWNWLSALTLAVGMPLGPGCTNGGQSGDLSQGALSKKDDEDSQDAGRNERDAAPNAAASDEPEPIQPAPDETDLGEPDAMGMTPVGSSASSTGWQKLPAPPLSGRVNAIVASIGQKLVVAGGWNATCPPGADCVLPDTPPFVDGAIYDLDDDQWSPIADAPLGLHLATTATAADALYALSHCGDGPTCPAGRTLLRYRSDANEWDQLPGPDSLGQFGLVTSANEIFAFSQSDETDTVPDYRWLPEEDRWQALPDDPLPPVYDRFMVPHAGRVFLFGSPIDVNAEDTKLAASYDPQTNSWQELTPSGTLGYQVWSAGDLLYLNPHFSSAGGGIYDPETDVWSPWPELPYHDLSGVIGDDEASYEYADGWVFDARSGSFLEIPPRPDASPVYDVVIGRVGSHGLVVFGGQKWVDEDGSPSDEGQLLNDTWLWTPPESLP